MYDLPTPEQTAKTSADSLADSLYQIRLARRRLEEAEAAIRDGSPACATLSWSLERAYRPVPRASLRRAVRARERVSGMAEVTADLSLPAKHAANTLSRAMRKALLGAAPAGVDRRLYVGRNGFGRNGATIGTVVALIRRGLAVAGTTNYLTDLGVAVRDLLKAQG